ncbi:MAG: glycine betaine/L-proline ABC transporter ATP-binding protein [Thermodesulfobacteriota bacterium]|nr:glycine betaine/L-proline ABC transporter ATP-binding protein [Thermodesulfobacteriota bacterium]
MPEPKIVVKNIEKIFGKNVDKARRLVESGTPKNEILEQTGCAVGVFDASFEVYEGETLVIMGLSGSGKSTLIRCINRLHNPTRGKVTVDGTDVTKLNDEELRRIRQEKFAMVFQRFALLPHRTILENAAFGLELQEMELEKRQEKARDALKLVGLEGWENVYPEQLSGGMQQRVGLARALAVDTDILLMDEAFSALDPLIRAEMQDELLALEDRVQKTIIFITHDLDEALKIGDRIVLMKDARIVQIGTPEEILKEPATEYVKRFVENVDMTKVLSANDVMLKAASVTVGKDGPRTALHMMKERGISNLFAVDKSRRLRGIIAADDAEKAVKEKAKSIEHIILDHEAYKVQPDTPLEEIMPLMVDLHVPVAVVDEDNKLVGIIVRGSILAGLTTKENDETTETA